MAELQTPPKRHRDESQDDSVSEFNESKRQKPFNNILNLLDEEPSHEPSHELSHDLSAIFTILQQELSSSDTFTTTTFDFDPLQSTAPDELSHHTAECGGAGDEDESVKSVMRHLLEASDDELGIPTPREHDQNINVVEGLKSGENNHFSIDDNGLWDLEDEAANYYTVFQSELFMQ